MEEDLANTTSPALWAFVTLILTIANSRTAGALMVDGCQDADVTADHPPFVDREQAFAISRGWVSRQSKMWSRSLTLGPFVTLILTLRHGQAANGGKCQLNSSPIAARIENAAEP